MAKQVDKDIVAVTNYIKEIVPERSVEARHIADGSVDPVHVTQNIRNQFLPVGSIIPYFGGYFTSGASFVITEAGGNNSSSVNSALPDKWRVCDGSSLNDSESPIFNSSGRYLPNLDDGRFIMGDSSVGWGGGNDSRSHQHGYTPSALGNHAHASGNITARIGRTTLGAYPAGETFIGMQVQNPGGWTPNQRFLSRNFPGFSSSITEPAPYSASTSPHSEGTTTNVDLSHGHQVLSGGGTNIPRYLSCFYIMKVK